MSVVRCSFLIVEIHGVCLRLRLRIVLNVVFLDLFDVKAIDLEAAGSTGVVGLLIIIGHHDVL